MNPSFHWIIGAGLIALVAVLDVTKPFDRSFSIFYLLPPLYVGWTIRGRMELVFYAAILLAAYFAPLLSASHQLNGYGIFNRSVGAVLGSLIVFLMWDRRRYVAALHRANEELEAKVAARTAKLEEVYQHLLQEAAEHRQSEQRFARFMEHLPGLAWIKDLQLRYVYVSDAAEKRFRMSRTEICGKTDEQIFPLETAHQFTANDLAALASKAGVQLVEALEHEDGETHHSLVSKFPIPGPDGAPALVGGIAIDITERRRAEEALRESEERYRGLFHQILLPVFAYDLETLEFLAVNDAAVRHYGWSQEEFLAMTLKDIKPPQDIPALLEAVSNIKGEANQTRSLRRHWRKDGSLIDVEVNGYSMIFAGRRAETVVINDVTERKQVEEALRLSEEKFAKAFAASPTAIVITRAADGTILDANDSYLKMLAYSRAELVGKTTLELGIITPTDRAQLVQIMHECGRLREQEIDLRKKTGESIQVVYSSETIELKSEPCLISIAQEVTDRKRAEEARRLSEERLRQAVRVARVGVFDHDHRSDTLHWTEKMYEICDWDEDKPVALAGFVERIHPQDRDAVAAAIRRAHDPAGDGVYEVEHRLVRADGTIRWVASRSQTSFEGQGSARRAVRTIGALLDITEIKRVDEQRAEMEQRLRQAQKMEAVGQLAGGIAHDFNNLLTVINGYSSLMLKAMASGDPQGKFLRQIARAGERAASLTSQLLAYSRKTILQPKVLNLNDVLGTTEEMLERLIGEDIDLFTDYDPDLERVKVDPGQIEQVVVNLAINARDAMPSGGKLTLQTRNVTLNEAECRAYPGCKPGRYVMICVTDTGCGMTSDVQSHIFEPFFTTKEIGKGTGLGLATAYGIIKQSEGYIAFASRPGIGTAFEVFLPVVPEMEHPFATQQDVESAKPGTETVLLVEDEKEVRDLVRFVLESNSYRVLEAMNGREALAIANDHEGTIHMVITDVVMPEMNGRQLVESLRLRRHGIRVLYMSGYTNDAIVRHGIAETKDAFVQKPFSPVLLATTVRDILDGNQ
jgi:PAS domain S-box-containing protein